jgi:hypothetical protein
MTQIIPVESVQAQTLRVVLNKLACRIDIYHKSPGLFLDLLVDDALIVGGVLCLDRVLIVRDLYLDFIGDIAFVDTQGRDDPVYTGLGTRWLLLHLAPADFIKRARSA